MVTCNPMGDVLSFVFHVQTGCKSRKTKEDEDMGGRTGVDAVSPFDACASCICPRCVASLVLSRE